MSQRSIILQKQPKEGNASQRKAWGPWWFHTFNLAVASSFSSFSQLPGDLWLMLHHLLNKCVKWSFLTKLNILSTMVHSLPRPCLFNSAMQLSYDLQALFIEMLIIIICIFVALNFASRIRCWAMKLKRGRISSSAKRRNIFTEKVLMNFIKTRNKHNLMVLRHSWVNYFLCILSMDLINQGF